MKLFLNCIQYLNNSTWQQCRTFNIIFLMCTNGLFDKSSENLKTGRRRRRDYEDLTYAKVDLSPDQIVTL